MSINIMPVCINQKRRSKKSKKSKGSISQPIPIPQPISQPIITIINN
jgi:hypothetical protein